MRALYSAASGMAAQQTRLDNIANNLANVNTTGFKKSREAFEDLFYQQMTSGGQGVSTSRVDMGTGVRLAALEKDQSQGQLTATGEPLDVAIQGNAMFVVESPDGTRSYTRDGKFTRDGDGTMQTQDGLKLTGNVMIPSDAQTVTIGIDGTVSAVLSGQTDPTTLGQIELATFVNTAGLRPLGDNLYAETPESGQPMLPTAQDGVQLKQGFLEGSNVDVAEELVQMILAQRSYEMNSKVVQAADETLQVAANLKK